MSDEYPRHTLLEADDDTAQVQAALRRQAASKKKAPSVEDQQQLFRPTSRPLLALLTVLDDGRRTGEQIRIRSDKFVIGRTEGDLRIHDDELISSRHVAITKQKVSGKMRLVISDLQSRNGVFAKVSKAPVEDQTELLIGAGHYRFELSENSTPPATEAFSANGIQPPARTRAFGEAIPSGNAVLAELTANGVGARIVLHDEEYTIGQSRECKICRNGDVFTSDVHAFLRRSAAGRWMIENNRSLNGVWLRMPQITLEPNKSCEFRIGEQLFHLKFGA